MIENRGMGEAGEGRIGLGELLGLLAQVRPKRIAASDFFCGAHNPIPAVPATICPLPSPVSPLFIGTTRKGLFGAVAARLWSARFALNRDFYA
jgi:hypothetical protein